ncbi:MAG: amidase [Phascolarctobacterium sp.]|nr:MAG: amidase [Phascolarctobacterium sp.]
MKEWTISAVHEAMQQGKLTCLELVQYYLERIKQYDGKLHSIILVNPNAEKEAAELDEKFKHSGFTGPLHGIPVILKDNVETDDMPTTAGSIALKGFEPHRNAFIVKRLKAAGALILAKANLHEFAIWGETVSSILGPTYNPYDLTRTPGGSSGGTGAAIAADFGIIGIGTDTINSVRSPSSANNLVGIRPTIGMVSRSGIVPYSLTQDTAGPLCRTVEDAARTLSVIAGYDEDDEITAWSYNKVQNFEGGLEKGTLEGKRIGILRSFFGKEEINRPVNEVMEKALGVLQRGGAELVEITDDIDSAWLTSEVSVHLDDFNDHLTQYLQSFPADKIPVHSLKEIYDSGKYHPVDKGNMEDALKLSTYSAHYNEKLLRQQTVKNKIMQLIASKCLDCIVYPHQQQLVCKIGDSQKQRNGVLCSVTGFPSVVVPAGFAPAGETAPLGVPVGMEIIGEPWSEKRLLMIAAAYEKDAQMRKAPVL